MHYTIPANPRDDWPGDGSVEWAGGWRGWRRQGLSGMTMWGWVGIPWATPVQTTLAQRWAGSWIRGWSSPAPNPSPTHIFANWDVLTRSQGFIAHLRYLRCAKTTKEAEGEAEGYWQESNLWLIILWKREDRLDLISTSMRPFWLA